MVVNNDDPRPAAVRGARGGRAHARLGWRSPAARGIVKDTSVPSPRTLRTVAEPPRRAILAGTDSASPFRSPGTAPGSKPPPRSRPNSDTVARSTPAKRATTTAPDPLTPLH